MRAWLVLCFLTTVSIVSGGCTGDDEVPVRAADTLDCEWVRSTKNCWTTMAKALDACLTSDPTAQGRLEADGRSCTYDKTGRTITGSVSLVPDADSNASPVRDFVVKTATGTECVHVQESNSVLTVGFAGSALTVSTANDQVVLTCPDGAVFKGPRTGLSSCYSPSSGIPGYAWASGDDEAHGVYSTFSLLGMAAPLYACKTK